MQRGGAPHYNELMISWVLVAVLAVVTGVWAWWNIMSFRRAAYYQANQLDEAGAHGNDSSSSDDASWPAVTIICPGRNEAEQLPRTLGPLCEQDYPGVRVVFIDDDSDDQTPTITADHAQRYSNLLVVRNEGQPPPGWVGKCWAIKRGYDALNDWSVEAGDATAAKLPETDDEQYLCFTDADIDWDRRCLRAAVRYALERDADLLAVLPQLEFGSPVERLTQSVVFLGFVILFPFHKAIDPTRPDLVLSGGAFMLVRRRFYDQIGGHASVADCMVDDLNLGLRLKQAGAKVRLAFTPNLLRCRMYHGWSDMWEGFTKNFYAGLEYRPVRFAAFFVLTLLLWVLSPVYVIESAVWLFQSGGAPAAVAAGLSVGLVLLQARLMGRFRVHLKLGRRYAWMVPIGAALTLVVATGSVWRYYFGGNRWKGRRYGRDGVK